jgi:hypothetical protein
MFNVESLDKELEEIDFNTEEGKAKITKAQELLPIHYKTIIDIIGGTIEKEFNLDRLPEQIRNRYVAEKVNIPCNVYGINIGSSGIGW